MAKIIRTHVELETREKEYQIDEGDLVMVTGLRRGYIVGMFLRSVEDGEIKRPILYLNPAFRLRKPEVFGNQVIPIIEALPTEYRHPRGIESVILKPPLDIIVGSKDIRTRLMGTENMEVYATLVKKLEKPYVPDAYRSRMQQILDDCIKH